MQNKQLQKLLDWFDEYVQSFYGDDEFLNANIELKDKHSRRVCKESRFLTDKLDINEADARLAEAVAILHDVGRFRQFTEYRTYNDAKSINHSALGLEVIRENNILGDLPAKQGEIIETAIKLHNARLLPSGLDDKTLLQCKLIRDADKLDIYYVVVNYYNEYHNDPQNFKLEIELPDSPGYSAEIVEEVIKGERVDYRKLKNWNDMKVLQLSWIYDINFVPALVRIKKQNYLQRILDYLPEDDNILRLRGIIFDYLDKRIDEGKSFKKENLAG